MFLIFWLGTSLVRGEKKRKNTLRNYLFIHNYIPTSMRGLADVMLSHRENRWYWRNYTLFHTFKAFPVYNADHLRMKCFSILRTRKSYIVTGCWFFGEENVSMFLFMYNIHRTWHHLNFPSEKNGETVVFFFFQDKQWDLLFISVSWVYWKLITRMHLKSGENVRN